MFKVVLDLDNTQRKMVEEQMSKPHSEFKFYNSLKQIKGEINHDSMGTGYEKGFSG